MATRKPDAPTTDAAKTGMDAATKLAQMSIDHSRRIMELQLKLARELFGDGLAGATRFASTTEPGQAMSARLELGQRTAQRMMDAARELTEMNARVQADMAKLLSQQFAGGPEIFGALGKALPGMKLPDNPAMAAFQAAMDNARGAFEQMSATTSQALGQFAAMGGMGGTGAKRGK